MASAQVVLRGRFKPGTVVRLVRVRDESVLRSEGGEDAGTATVSEDGEAKFTSGVVEGARYLIVGLVDGFPLEVRARGRAADDPNPGLEQAPVQTDRVRLGDGSWSDEAPKQHQKSPSAMVAPGPAQHQVPKGQWQRSDTPRGSAHPHDPSEMLPYPDQSTVKKGTVQMSDTEHGLATPVSDAPERQDQVPAGVWQRSATPLGTAEVIPDMSAVEAKKEAESSTAKALRGEPVKAQSDPISATRGKRSKRATPDEKLPGDEPEEPRVPDERSEEERTADVGKSRAHGSSVQGGKGADAIKKQSKSSKRS